MRKTWSKRDTYYAGVVKSTVPAVRVRDLTNATRRSSDIMFVMQLEVKSRKLGKAGERAQCI